MMMMMMMNETENGHPGCDDDDKFLMKLLLP
jgi:hypothetical protein